MSIRVALAAFKLRGFTIALAVGALLIPALWRVPPGLSSFGAAAGQGERRAQAGPAQDDGGCSGLHPAFAQALFIEPSASAGLDRVPAIVRLRPPFGLEAPPASPPEPIATAAEVGSVYGLAWDAARLRLYAASYHKRGMPLGPAGPGAIYAIDRLGAVETLVTIDVGPDRHDASDASDAGAIPWVGRSGLGDIEVDSLGRWLFAVDLGSRRIHRVDLASGTIDRAFGVGGSDAAWAAASRPFGLAWHEGWLYHLVAIADSASAAPEIRVFRSREDGASMAEIGRFDLGYARRPAWSGWHDRVDRISGAQPLAVDLDILGLAGGQSLGLIGLRDRVADLSPSPAAPLAVHTGDLLVAQIAPDGTWSLGTDFDRLDGRSFIPEATWGSLALWPELGQLVAPLYLGRQKGALAWLDVESGVQLGTREAYAVDIEGENRVHGMGDVERLCPPSGPDPERAAEATAVVAIPTATAAAGVDAALRRACERDTPYYASSIFVPGFMPELGVAPAILAVEDGSGANPSGSALLASQSQLGTVHGLAWDAEGRKLYAAAFNKAATRFGPGGPGAIYRLDSASGDLRLLARLPAGPDRHRFDPSDYYNDPARDWVGMSGLGDLEWLDASIFALGLSDRKIYRIDPESGRTLDIVEHGAAAEPWADLARPFALASFEGRLYHGLVRSQPAVPDGPVTAHVYRSAPNGSAMTEVLRFDLDSPRPSGARPWGAWGRESEPGPEPWLTDLAFRPDGSMLLAFKDRRVDSHVYLSSPGEIYEARRLGDDRWALAQPQGLGGALPPGALAWGALASAPLRAALPPVPSSLPDRFSLTALHLVGANSGGLAWLEGPTAGMDGLASLFELDPSRDEHGRSKVSGLGDVEVLCAGLPDPTARPRPTPTPLVAPSPRPSPTRAVQGPIYLPLLLGEDCPDRRPLDLVLVLDLSSSMRLSARDGRAKLEVAIEAARRFLAGLALGADGDHAALVGFNARAWTAAPLTAQLATLDLALARMERQVSEGTRLDLGLEQGAAALQARRRAAQPLLLLITDGLPNGVPTPRAGGGQAEAVLDEARRLKSSGLRIITVALGRPDDPNPAARIDLALMAAIASRGSDAYQAPDALDLDAVLSGLRPDLSCPR